MDLDRINSIKKQSDKLISSYGVFSLPTKLEEAIAQIAEMWGMNHVEMQILRPGKCIAISNALKKATSLANSSGVGVATKHAVEVGKASGVSGKLASAVGKFEEAQTALKSAGKTAVNAARSNPKIALGVALAGGAIGFFSVRTFKRELKHFNEGCYKIRILQLEEK